ncbi:MAG: hypothetical protein ACRYGO_23455 [Janthinobacterium lividum]
MSYSCYQPSGAVPARAFLLAAPCFALACALSIPYAWLTLRLPGLLDFFLCFALAFALAGAVRAVCAVAKVRNPRWAGRFGVLLGLCGWYLQWSAWIAFQLDDGGGSGVLQLASQPASVAAHAMALVAPASGLEQLLWYTGWLGELWALLFFPYFMGKMRAEQVFDEAAGEWAHYVESPKKFRLVEQTALLDLLHARSGVLSDILAEETDQGVRKYARLRVYCRGADGALVSIVTVEIKGSDGDESVIESSPGSYLRVSAAELDELLAETPAGGDAGEADPPELVDAIDRLQAGDFQAAYALALPFVGAGDRRLHCDANRICAMVCSQSGRWTEALAYWKTLFAGESTAHNALQVATSLVMANETEEGLMWVERARTLNAVSQEMSGVAIITGILSALSAANQHGAALPFVAQLRDFYTQLRVTDPTFLFVRRMPLFHVFLEKSAEIVDKVMGAQERRAWYASMLPHLDERGREELLAWLDGAGAPAPAC